MSDAFLKLTDGTTTINLLDGAFRLKNWSPSWPASKGGGVFSDSPVSEGRRLSYYVSDSPIEAFTLVQTASDADEMASWSIILTKMVMSAKNYWKSGAGSPVYLIAKAPCEDNPRYALVIDASISGLNTHYGQPFVQPGSGSVQDDIILTITREPWQESAPGQDVCVPVVLRADAPDVGDKTLAQKIIDSGAFVLYKLDETSGAVAANSTQYPANLDAGYQNVTLNNKKFITGDGAPYFNPASSARVEFYSSAFDDAFNRDAGTIMVWGWFGASTDWTDATKNTIFRIANLDNDEITIYVLNSFLTVDFIGDSAAVSRTLFSAPAISPHELPVKKWWNVCVTWDVEEDDLRIYFQGHKCVDSTSLPSWSGSVIDPNKCYIGATTSTTNEFDGNLSHFAMWTRALTMNEVRDLVVMPLDEQIEPENLCESSFLANKHVHVQLSHIYVDDGGVFGSNLVESSSFPLFPASPAVNDAVYFGVEDATSNGLPAAPFTSLVFDLIGSRGDSGDYQTQWEYWDGAAWQNWAGVDRTGYGTSSPSLHFALDGVNAAAWYCPTDWAQTAVNGVTGFWMRNRITAFTSMPNVPEQQNRPVYICNWPFIKVRHENVPGDLAALARVYIDRISFTAIYPTNKVIMGTRSMSRGEGFVSHLNAADGGHNPAYIEVIPITDSAPDATATWVSAIGESPTGRALEISTTTTVSVSSNSIVGEFNIHRPNDFIGRFRLFARLKVVSGAANDPILRLRTIPPALATDAIDISAYTTDMGIVDFGIIDLPGLANNVDVDEFHVFTIEVLIAASGSTTTNLYDIILMPVDELAIETVAASSTAIFDSTLDNQGSLVIDSTLAHRTNIRSMLTGKKKAQAISGAVTGIQQAWSVRAGGKFVLNPSSDSKLFVVSLDDTESYDTTLDEIHLYRNARYSYLRGIQ